ncbi:hypothetical protein BCR44DRAFT_1428663 [Catenaria anguillulae PL171]|uniref:Uncharacterized protein n=1 Tax=Catenaria anguillulae PL171 TaxID=765915 RepID=A0A1Y2HVM0_9FUNG|nr:hypothetical protein BCR44DRAFT_1428663 [Catenaria anguillulae PL171]
MCHTLCQSVLRPSTIPIHPPSCLCCGPKPSVLPKPWAKCSDARMIWITLGYACNMLIC